jgi:hypothetical protein
MTTPTIDYQANLFLYDLDNRAKEHWFKSEEKWEIVIATLEEKTAIEKKYFPVVNLDGAFPEMKAIAQIVNNKLKPFAEISYPIIKGNENVWLLAYTPTRVRT